jgi:nucleoside 2-deoxyribosyltransferase
MTKTVYLAGPITGLSYAGATDWREAAKRALLPDIEALSPMRAKEYLAHVGEFTSDGDAYEPYSVMSTNRGITTRDRWDATRCDVLLVNLLGARAVSIGTVMEIAWADLVRKPIVIAMEPEGNPHEHGMVKEATGFRVPTLEAALHVVRAILLP